MSEELNGTHPQNDQKSQVDRAFAELGEKAEGAFREAVTTAADEAPSAEEFSKMKAALKKANDEAMKSRLRLKELEDKDLPEAERAKKQAEETAAELAALKRENVRKSVALSKGVPAELIEFLTGDTEDEVAAKADLLLSRLNAPTTPKPDLSQGASGQAKKASTGEQFADFFSQNLSN